MTPCERDENGKLLTVGGSTDIPHHLAHAAIPPAWTEVLVNTDPNSKLWATGRDSKNRRQPLYNPAYRAQQDAAKFASVQNLITQAELIQSTLEYDAKAGTNEAAFVAYLIFETGIRPGSEANTGGDVQAYGATTLLANHVHAELNGQTLAGTIRLQFIGKKGVPQDITVTNQWLAEKLWQRASNLNFRADRFLFSIDERDLRDYVATIGDGTARPKDFRTMKGTMLAAKELRDRAVPDTKKERKSLLKAVINVVCSALGNTPAVARKSYIAPSILAALAD